MQRLGSSRVAPGESPKRTLLPAPRPPCPPSRLSPEAGLGSDRTSRPMTNVGILSQREESGNFQGSSMGAEDPSVECPGVWGGSSQSRMCDVQPTAVGTWLRKAQEPGMAVWLGRRGPAVTHGARGLQPRQDKECRWMPVWREATENGTATLPPTQARALGSPSPN